MAAFLRTTLVLSLGLLVAAAASAQEMRDPAAGSARVDRAPRGAALTLPANGPRADVVAAFVRARHGGETADTLVVTRENPVERTGITHVEMGQHIAGLQVYGTYVRAAMTARGELVSVIENLVRPGRLVPAAATPRQALEAVLARHYGPLNLPETGAAGETTTFGRGSVFDQEPSVTRVAVPMNDHTMHVGYLVITWDRANMLRHTVVGAGGRILHEEVRTNTDTYKVFPDHPGNSTQTVVSGPGGGNAQSPIGWVTSNTTIGNNVDAYLDRDNNNAADPGGRPVSSTQTFEYTVDLTQSPTTTTNQMAAVTNLFYLNNVIHDKLYQHGFTEAAGNFQTNNFGKGGLGNDPVNAEAQDGGGTNNANFATPSDGSRPRMQMYLWTRTTPNRDGDLDSDIVWHEYGHGLTWRMIGGMSGPLAGAIGEGMSDTLSIYINRNDVVGEYSYNSAIGIRRYPYTNYPLTYGNVTGSSVHSDGEIYAAAMWKLLELWEAAGYTQDRLFDYIVDGMNYTPSRPAYEHMRDGILAASPTQEKDCVIWRAFAQFGIGEGAQGRESCRIFTCSVSISESFVVPSACSSAPNTPPTVSITAPANNASFVQDSEVTFTGTASDTQDDDLTLSASIAWTSSLNGSIGTGASVSTSSLAQGTHTITASVTDSGGLSATATISITITGPPLPGGITLSARGYKVQGNQRVDLTWSGATSNTVDVYRDTLKIVTENDGAHTDNINKKGGGSYVYRVCNAGTTTCSDNVTVTF
jgi:extracellular elastinolytic metalloproteinase